MNHSRLVLRHLEYRGPGLESARLEFQDGLNLVYGASNTGKSFAIKSIDFMLGGSKDLPDIKERVGYDTVWMGLSIEGYGDFSLSRSTKGGSIEVFEGLVPERKILVLDAQDRSGKSSISQFLLERLGIDNRKIAKDSEGKTERLTFRDLTTICLVSETAIQSERSPIESEIGVVKKTRERSVFRMLITGSDDSKFVARQDKKSFTVSKKVRAELIEDMLLKVNEKLLKYGDQSELNAQFDRLTTTLGAINTDIEVVRKSIRRVTKWKHNISRNILSINQRYDEIDIHLKRFDKLNTIYNSDIERMKALEEAGFMLSLESMKDCSVCGAPAELQKHKIAAETIHRTRAAALAEVRKIELQRSDLQATILNMKNEKMLIERKRSKLERILDRIEDRFNKHTPIEVGKKKNLGEIIDTRDKVKAGLVLFEQKKELSTLLDEFNRLKRPQKSDQISMTPPKSVIHDFCKTVSEVLTAWGFPGGDSVSFDEKSYDLVINGNLRTNNGKGVRAITHSAFKVALLLFCQRNSLPHPGFLVLDTPLLTYRDPIKDPLNQDEKELLKSDLKNRFFEHLVRISEIAQIVIIENIDPPDSILRMANVQVFSGNLEAGRFGLFPKETI